MKQKCIKSLSNLLSEGKEYNIIKTAESKLTVMTDKGVPMNVSLEYFDSGAKLEDKLPLHIENYEAITMINYLCNEFGIDDQLDINKKKEMILERIGEKL